MVPTNVLYDGWWKDGPWLLEKEGLERWAALYVTHVDLEDDSERPTPRSIICLRGGSIANAQEPEFYWYYPWKREFQKLLPDVDLNQLKGRFLELGKYSDREVVKLRDHQNDALTSKSLLKKLPQLDLEELRYLNNFKF